MKSLWFFLSIPFFFEPNFDANIEILAAYRRLQKGGQGIQNGAKEYSPVVYGDFLMKKVGNNFADGKGKYDWEAEM